MEIWKRQAAISIDAARSAISDECFQRRKVVTWTLKDDLEDGRSQEVLELLLKAKELIDVNDEIDWEFQTPLPF